MKETRRMRSTTLAASALALSVGLAIGGFSLAQPVVHATAKTAAKTTILPGHWEYDYKIGVIPVSSETKCLKPADAEQFSRGICTRRYRCDYTTNVVKDGKIQLKGTWTDKKDIHIKTISGMNLAGSMNAKRISAECPAEETAAK